MDPHTDNLLPKKRSASAQAALKLQLQFTLEHSFTADRHFTSVPWQVGILVHLMPFPWQSTILQCSAWLPWHMAGDSMHIIYRYKIQHDCRRWEGLHAEYLMQLSLSHRAFHVCQCTSHWKAVTPSSAPVTSQNKHSQSLSAALICRSGRGDKETRLTLQSLSQALPVRLFLTVH